MIMIALVPTMAFPFTGVDAAASRPRIEWRSVRPDADNVWTFSQIKVGFDRPVTGVHKGTFVLRDGSGEIVPAVVRYNATTDRARLVPRKPLAPDSVYYVALSRSIRSHDGASLGWSAWSFRTGSQAERGRRFASPRRVDFEPGRVTAVRFDGDGRVTYRKSVTLTRGTAARASHRAVVRDRPFLYITSGRWAGLYVADTSSVTLAKAGDKRESTESRTSPSPSAPPSPSSAPEPSDSRTSPSPAPSATAEPTPTASATAKPSPTPTPTPTAAAPQPVTSGNILGIDLSALPASGAAWERVFKAAQGDWGAPELGAPRDDDATNVLAGAFVAARTGDSGMRAKVVKFLEGVQRTPPDTSDLLAAARELGGYVIAASVINYHEPAFKTWVAKMVDLTYTGGGGVPKYGDDIRSLHEKRPNNWGTWAYLADAASAAYLGDTARLAKIARIRMSWVGEDLSSTRHQFMFQSTVWQSGPHAPIGITLPGDAHFPNGGVVPDDQRRGGESWTCENYVHEALQGVVSGNIVLAANGYPGVWRWGQNAVYRAFELQEKISGCRATGDDEWMLHVTDRVYGLQWSHAGVSSPGKGFGWTDWLYGP